jgi:hypothetical protein
MWAIFSQMIDGNEKEIIFLDNEDKILFNYILPSIRKTGRRQKRVLKQFLTNLAA